MDECNILHLHPKIFTLRCDTPLFRSSSMHVNVEKIFGPYMSIYSFGGRLIPPIFKHKLFLCHHIKLQRRIFYIPLSQCCCSTICTFHSCPLKIRLFHAPFKPYFLASPISHPQLSIIIDHSVTLCQHPNTPPIPPNV